MQRINGPATPEQDAAKVERLEARMVQRLEELGLERLAADLSLPERDEPALADQPTDVAPPPSDAFSIPSNAGKRLLLRSLRTMLRVFDRITTQDLDANLKGAANDLATRYRADSSWLFDLNEAERTLKTVAASAITDNTARVVPLDRTGIVPRTAASRLAYHCADVALDPLYDPYLDQTQCEQAAPIRIDQHAQTDVLGVINQESRLPGQFSPASAWLLQEDATAELAPFLWARKSLLTPTGNRVGVSWSPYAYGWDLRGFLRQLLLHAKEDLGRAGDAIQMTVWLADWEDRILFALATTGFDAEFAIQRTLQFSDDKIFNRLVDATVPDAGTWREGDPGNSRPHLDYEMGLRQFRAANILGQSEYGADNATVRTVALLSVQAFTPGAESILPDEDELKACAGLVGDVIARYLSLYPTLAAAEVRRALHRCPMPADRLRVAAKTISDVLEADAVTVFARPRHKDDLHVIAATAPLESGHAPGELQPQVSPLERSKSPSGHTVGDRVSYAGTLGGRPGEILRRNSYKDSGRRLRREDWPIEPHPNNRESLPRTVGTDPRFLGISLRSPFSEISSLGVFLVVRSMDRPPFTVWDGMALKAMVSVCEDEVRSWRDWFDAQTTAPVAPALRPLVEPLPRLGAMTLRSTLRDLARQAHDLCKSRGLESTLQAAILMERPEANPPAMHTVGYFAELSAAVPAKDQPFDLSPIRLPDVADWTELLDDGAPHAAKLSGDAIQACVRVPLLTWVGRHPARGALAVDMTQQQAIEPDTLDELLLMARKISAAMAVAGTKLRYSRFMPSTVPGSFVRALRDHLGALTVTLRFKSDAFSNSTQSTHFWSAGPTTVRPAAGDWMLPTVASSRAQGMVTLDRDAVRWGIMEARTETGMWLRVPLCYGTIHVGHVVAFWEARGTPDPEEDTTRAQRTHNIVAAWLLWSWSWLGSRGCVRASAEKQESTTKYRVRLTCMADASANTVGSIPSPLIRTGCQ